MQRSLLIVLAFTALISGCNKPELMGEWKVSRGDSIELPQPLTHPELSKEKFDSDAKMKYVFFFATYCPQCIQEIHYMKAKLAADDSVTKALLAISVDESKELAQEFSDNHQIPFPVIWDENQQFSNKVGGEFIPRGFLIDSNNKIVKIVEGFTEADIDEIFTALKQN